MEFASNAASQADDNSYSVETRAGVRLDPREKCPRVFVLRERNRNVGEPVTAKAVELSLGWNWLLVGFGGAVGSIARYEIGRRMIPASAVWHFPLGTFVINVLGSFILGLAAALILEKPHA